MDEIQIASTLKKIKKTASRAKNNSLATQEKEIFEMMQQHLSSLKLAYEKKGADKTNFHLKKLIELRARQVIILLQKKQKQGKLKKEDISRATDKFYQDCQKLVASATVLLNK